MPLRSFLSHLEHDPTASRLADEGGSAFVSQALRPYLLAALADRDVRRPTVVVAGDDRSARDLAADLRAWLRPRPVRFYPSRGVAYESHLTPPPHLVGLRVAALDALLDTPEGSEQPVVVVSAVALSEKVPDPKLRPHGFTLRVGELLDLDEAATDLVVEEVDADGALLRRRVDVQQPAANGELAALLDLVDALVAGGHEVPGGLVEVEQVADLQDEAVRAQLRVRDLLGQRGGRHDHDGLLGALGRVGERVERGDAQADEVRRRRQVRLVGDAAARVVADRARRQPGAQVGGEIARGAVVADDDQRGPLGVLVGERGDDEGAQ